MANVVQMSVTSVAPAPLASETFAQVLRQARLARGWSRDDLAARVGVLPAYILAIESGDTFPPVQSRVVDDLALWLVLDTVRLRQLAQQGRVAKAAKLRLDAARADAVATLRRWGFSLTSDRVSVRE